METTMRCQVCGKRTHELRNWFDKMVCKKCFLSNQELTLEIKAK